MHRTAKCVFPGVIGDPCHVNTDCSDVIEFSECAEVNGSAICQCDEEHMPANNGTFCAIRKRHIFCGHFDMYLIRSENY